MLCIVFSWALWPSVVEKSIYHQKDKHDFLCITVPFKVATIQYFRHCICFVYFFHGIYSLLDLLMFSANGHSIPLSILIALIYTMKMTRINVL